MSTETPDLPGPDDQDLDLDAEVPTPADVDERAEDPAASHGDFHDRPGAT